MISRALTGPFFDHSRRDIDASIDVLAVDGEERLSQPFKYLIEFTNTQHDIDAEKILGKHASFSLYTVPKKLPFLGLEPPKSKKDERLVARECTENSFGEKHYQLMLCKMLKTNGLEIIGFYFLRIFGVTDFEIEHVG